MVLGFRVMTVLLLIALPAVSQETPEGETTPKSIKSFASPVHAGCYLAAPNECRIHVDPFTANVATGERLEKFQLKANGNIIYDFGMDVSNAPIDDYTPTLVGLDFAVVCGNTYQVSALTKDSGDPSLGVAGLTAEFTCPSGTPPL
jgi:hypothetical protein